ncbi:hypothetical protein Fmac_023814 [Flemingia macrophylla]|uniref:Uncharacterized protein n=1 Tax=Flemingia macrophylla TaxID=520843 RepID=A0ABD1LMR5_9FABA
MSAKEVHLDQEVGNEERTLLHADPYEEEEEETLSLCDLPIYNGSVSARWDGEDHSYNNGGGDYDNDKENELFEFFSEEFTTSSNTNIAAADNIIFCGKLIPFKAPRDESNNNIVQKGRPIDLPWRQVDKAREGSLEGKGSKSFACDYTSIGKVSLVRSTTKSRWFLFMFGSMSKLSSTEMELRDIRNRQSRRRAPAATMFPAPQEVAAAKENSKGRSCKGMWKLLKSFSFVLGCRTSKIANDVVKVAIV